MENVLGLINYLEGCRLLPFKAFMQYAAMKAEVAPNAPSGACGIAIVNLTP